jgi:hypothetical protein
MFDGRERKEKRAGFVCVIQRDRRRSFPLKYALLLL